jgi:hypothetical protein
MSTTRLARWFLLRLARGPQRESLIGDLDEQLARGRPSFWYWRQAVSAIVAGLQPFCLSRSSSGGSK